jgi:uncharacterized protein
MKNCLIIFAREPRAGKVKTRLQRYFSKDRCLRLYKAFLKDIFDTARRIKYVDKVLAYESSTPEARYLRKIAGDFIFYKQKGNDLGEKMNNAFEFAKESGFNKAVLIGSDLPDLPLSRIKQAYKKLDKSDLVLGPSHDGGYYLIGLKKPCSGIFGDIKWSSETVFMDTLKNAGKNNKTISVLEKWHDIDDLAGLTLLKKNLEKNKKAALWTRKELKI